MASADNATSTTSADSPKPASTPKPAGAGLEGVVACATSISKVDGEAGRLYYHGYEISDLAEQATFAEVAYLLWYGRLPGQTELRAFLDTFVGAIKLPSETTMILRMFPRTATPMEMLRTAVSSLGHWDPDSGNTNLDACLRKAIRLTTRIPLLVTAHHRLRNGLEPVQPIRGQSIAYNILHTLHDGEPSELAVKALDVALVLHADHGMNASTFASRVTAATMSDIYSSVVSAIGTLKGPLHGGATEQVMLMLEEIGQPERADAWVRDALSRKVKIPGWGHRVYKVEDPRSKILYRWAERLSNELDDHRHLRIAQTIRQTMESTSKVHPNVDFYSGTCYRLMGIPPELFTPMFACSRVVGWTAHILEQWGDNRLIRPRSEYKGPLGLKFVPMEERQ
ncbi:MAG: citrate synthase [Phycisphaerae bacterium]|nr:citrate synthase [Phycisphaerae bacterium]